ncbi:ATP-binding protein [Streptomyces fagopyri]|uniref:ATP-binding protein n=1 Tax=Streptomyces fagopyri TaxID=2662397 RepID=UPI003405E783
MLRLAGSPFPPDRPASDRPAAALLEETDGLWHGLFAQDGRRLRCEVRDAPADVRVPGAPVAEILGVVLDNARAHGRGSVRVSVRDLTDALAFDVADEGALDVEPGRLFDRGHSGGDTGGTGIGLALARDLAASLGGRLLLTNAGPTTFTLLVPARQEEGQGERRDEYEGAGPQDGVADAGA